MHPDPMALKQVHWEEIKNIYGLLSYKFAALGTEDEAVNGFVTFDHFRNVIRATKYLTPKEKNLIIRLQKADKIKFSEFPDMLYNVRYEISSSEIME